MSNIFVYLYLFLKVHGPVSCMSAAYQLHVKVKGAISLYVINAPEFFDFTHSTSDFLIFLLILWILFLCQHTIMVIFNLLDIPCPKRNITINLNLECYFNLPH